MYTTEHTYWQKLYKKARRRRRQPCPRAGSGVSGPGQTLRGGHLFHFEPLDTKIGTWLRAPASFLGVFVSKMRSKIWAKAKDIYLLLCLKSWHPFWTPGHQNWDLNLRSVFFFGRLGVQNGVQILNKSKRYLSFASVQILASILRPLVPKLGTKSCIFDPFGFLYLILGLDV